MTQMKAAEQQLPEELPSGKVYIKEKVAYFCLHTLHKTKDAPSKPNTTILWLQFHDCSHLFQVLNADA